MCYTEKRSERVLIAFIGHIDFIDFIDFIEFHWISLEFK